MVPRLGGRARRRLAVAALLAPLSALPLLLAPGLARAQALTDYTVRPGDTCRAIARRTYGDADGLARLHANNPQLGPTPHRLVPGSVHSLRRALRAAGRS